MILKYKKLIKVRYIKFALIRLLKFKKSKWKSSKSYLKNKIEKILYKRVSAIKRRQTILLYRPKITARFPLNIKNYLVNKKKFNKKRYYKKKIRRYRYIKFKKLRSFNRYRKQFRHRALMKLINQSKTKGLLGRFKYRNKYYKDVVHTRIVMKYLFNQKCQAIKSNTTYKLDFFKKTFSNFFTVSGTISALFFYKTFENIRNNFKETQIELNSLNVDKNKNITNGDIIYIRDNNIIIRQNIRKAFLNNSFRSFLEYDMYSQQFAVIKNLDNLSNSDYNLMTIEYINKQHVKL